MRLQLRVNHKTAASLGSSPRLQAAQKMIHKGEKVHWEEESVLVDVKGQGSEVRVQAGQIGWRPWKGYHRKAFLQVVPNKVAGEYRGVYTLQQTQQ